MLSIDTRPMMMVASAITMLTIFVSALNALQANQTLEAFEDPHKQALYIRLTKELRCLVCQNQNLADSNADLAKDLRKKSYEMVDQGKSYQQIVEFMVTRYGDFVLYKPPFKSTTLLLWLSPFLLVIFIVLAIIRQKKATKPNEASLTQKQINEAKALIEKERNRQ